MNTVAEIKGYVLLTVLLCFANKVMLLKEKVFVVTVTVERWYASLTRIERNTSNMSKKSENSYHRNKRKKISQRPIPKSLKLLYYDIHYNQAVLIKTNEKKDITARQEAYSQELQFH